MVGATAASAAGVAASQAGMVTITLHNNFISAGGGNHLNADLTGDGVPDVHIGNAFNLVTTNGNGGGYTQYIAHVNLNGVVARADVFFYNGDGTLRLGSHHKAFGPTFSNHSGSLTGSIPVSFKDLHINGGALTTGSLEVTVIGDANRSSMEAKIQLDSLTYRSNSVPDRGSTLGLLALGASGVLALRKWRSERRRA